MVDCLYRFFHSLTAKAGKARGMPLTQATLSDAVSNLQPPNKIPLWLKIQITKR
jgi:hypothetical protein